jgi:hypothetical protein
LADGRRGPLLSLLEEHLLLTLLHQELLLSELDRVARLSSPCYSRRRASYSCSSHLRRDQVPSVAQHRLILVLVLNHPLAHLQSLSLKVVNVPCGSGFGGVRSVRSLGVCVCASESLLLADELVGSGVGWKRWVGEGRVGGVGGDESRLNGGCSEGRNGKGKGLGGSDFAFLIELVGRRSKASTDCR